MIWCRTEHLITCCCWQMNWGNCLCSFSLWQYGCFPETEITENIRVWAVYDTLSHLQKRVNHTLTIANGEVSTKSKHSGFCLWSLGHPGQPVLCSARHTPTSSLGGKLRDFSVSEERKKGPACKAFPLSTEGQAWMDGQDQLRPCSSPTSSSSGSKLCSPVSLPSSQIFLYPQ